MADLHLWQVCVGSSNEVTRICGSTDRGTLKVAGT